MYSVLVRFSVQPELVDEFIAVNTEFAAASVREETNTLAFELIQDENTPNMFYAHETYTDAKAFQAHMQGAVVQRYGPRLVPMIVGGIDDSIFIGKGFTITSSHT